MYPDYEKDKQKLKDLKEQLKNHPISVALALKDDYQKLEDEIQRLQKLIDDVELNPEDLMYPEFDRDKNKLEELIEKKKNHAYRKHEQLKNEHQKLQEEIENLSKKIDDVELNPEDLMYPEFDKDKQKLKEMKQNLLDMEKQLFDDKYKNLFEVSSDSKLKNQEPLTNDLSESISPENSESQENNLPENTESQENTPPENTEGQENNIPEEDQWLNSVKKISPWLAGTAGVTLGALGSIAIQANPLTQSLAYARLAYSAAKFANKFYSKHFLNGQPTAVDKWINAKSEQLQTTHPDFYAGVQKINEFLKKKETQWFLNGVSIGYTAGNLLNLREKVNSFRQPKVEAGPDIGPNASPDVDPDIGPDIGLKNASNTPNYEWLNTGENIDLSQVEYGFTDSIKAMNDTDLVHLAAQHATANQGTYIKCLKLPDGSNFTGNIGELLKSGIDPNTVAARVMNQNGDYAWMNLQDILDAAVDTVGKTR